MSNLQSTSDPQVFGTFLNCGCGVYFPGYEVHHIHARLAAKSDSWTPVLHMESRGNFLTLHVRGEQLEMWHHHPGQVSQAVQYFNSLPRGAETAVEYCPEFHLLSFTTGKNRWVLNLAKAENQRPS